jgi:hypothetical protein
VSPPGGDGRLGGNTETTSDPVSRATPGIPHRSTDDIYLDVWGSGATGFLHITTHVYYRRSVVEAWIADQEHQQGGGHRG